MKVFKNYEQHYQRHYGDDDKQGLHRSIKLDKVSLYNGSPASLDEYNKLLYDSSIEMEKISFNFLMKMGWLFRRFSYFGKRRKAMRANGPKLDAVFVHYMRKYANIDPKVFLGKDNVFLKILDYADDFFPNFDEEIDAFNKNYEYPYKYMTFACLVMVKRMDERLDLLKYGEEKKMKYYEFTDYVANYVNCYNEEHGKKYSLTQLRTNLSPFDVMKIKNYE
jgi:hypothetical protein